MKKFLSIALVLVMSLSLVTVAIATNGDDVLEDNLPVSRVITQAEFDELTGLSNSRLSRTGIACYIPYNTGSGTSGVYCAEFTADTTNMAFTLTSLGGGSKYHAQLYTVSSSGSYSAVNSYAQYSFGSGFTQGNLVVGTKYAIKISSTTVPSEGCNGTYNLTTF